MQLWPMVLWPKPRARQHAHIHLQFVTRSTKHKLLQIFIINVLLQITTAVTTKGVVAGSTPHYGNYAGVEAGLSNGYATRNYIKNYYQQQSAEASAKNHQQLHNEAAAGVEQQSHHVRGNEVFSHGFMGLPSDNYGNSIVARGEGEPVFSVHDAGLMPTTYTAAGQHYAASLVGLQAITDTNNVHPHMTMATMTKPAYTNTAANTIDLEQLQQYGPDNVAVADNKAVHHHRMFGRLSNYGEPVDNVDVATKNRGHAEDVGLQNYALAYADDVQQSTAEAAAAPATPVREQFYYKHNTHNDNELQQNFANYFTKTTAALPPTYEMANQQKYYTLNNYQQIEPQQQQQQRQSQQEPEQNNFYNRPLVEEQTYKLQALATATTQAPATFYQSFIKQNNNDNKQQYQQQQQLDGRLFNNYQHGNLKQQQRQQSQQHQQISANYLNKQLAKQQQPQYHLQQLQDRWQHEPDMAETSVTAHFRKQHKSKTDSKSKRSDYPEETYDLHDHDTDEISHIQLQQLQQLQQQLQQQQQQFVNLQHQLIDHDQQLQIQKHQVQQQPPILPPITHSIHHNPYSLQALAGTPLTKHTQIIKSIPVHQHHRVLVPFRHNVSIEVPDPIITTINKPTPIEIPVTKTIAVPDIQEVKIPIEKIMPYPVERPVPYIVEKRVPYAVEKQIAKPVYYNVPIKVPIVHTVVHKLHKPQHGHFAQENTVHDNYREPNHHRYRSHHLPHSVHKHVSSHGHRHGSGHSRYGGKYLK